MPGPRFWTPERDAYLRAHYGEMGAGVAVADALGTSPGAVYHRVRELRLQSPKHVWTAADDALLRAEYGRTPTAELAERVGATVLAVRKRAIVVLAPGRRRSFSRARWTPAMDAAVIKLYGIVHPDDLAARLKVSRWALARRALRLGAQAAANRLRVTSVGLAEANEIRTLLAWTCGHLSGEDAARALGLTPDGLVKRRAAECVAAVKALGGM